MPRSRDGDERVQFRSPHHPVRVAYLQLQVGRHTQKKEPHNALVDNAYRNYLSSDTSNGCLTSQRNSERIFMLAGGLREGTRIMGERTNVAASNRLPCTSPFQKYSMFRFISLLSYKFVMYSRNKKKSARPAMPGSSPFPLGNAFILSHDSV